MKSVSVFVFSVFLAWRTGPARQYVSACYVIAHMFLVAQDDDVRS